MKKFLNNAKKKLALECTNLEECKTIFISTMKFYQFKPKTGTLEECNPYDFFDLWLLFCKDVKDIWKKELINLEREK